MKWQVLKMLWPYLLQNRTRVILAFVMLALAKAASIAVPFLLKYIVDGLDAQTSASDSPLIGLVGLPLLLILIYGLARFLNVILSEVRDTLFSRVTERTIRRVSLQTFQHLHCLDLKFHLDRRMGGLSRDLERGNSGISFLMHFMTFNVLPTLIELIIVIAIFLTSYGLIFAWVIVVTFIFYLLFSLIATEHWTKCARAMNAADSATNNRAVESLLNYETIKYFTNEDYEARLYDRELANWEQAKRNFRLSLFVLNSGQAFIVAVSMTFILFLAALGIANSNMTMGDFVLINAFMMQLFIPLNVLGVVYREVKGALANIEEMFNLLQEKAHIYESANAAILKDPLPSIEFRKVNFSYRDDRQVLADVTFRINPGEKVAVVGASGSGKSTLIKLLFRLYDCDSGDILVGGGNIRELQVKSLRQKIGIVPQDTVLFNDTIYNNVLYGRPEATEAEVLEAIRLSQLDTLIRSRPEGGATMVGERGLKLSGGEKQRVAIARTILKNPSILVLDEATSALDSNTERSILRALREFVKGHTCLMIAHRLSTVVDANLILVLEKGRIIESGTHQGLLVANGVYARMWYIQQQDAKKEEKALGLM